MTNPSTLKQNLEKTKQDIQKATGDLSAKEAQLKKSNEEILTLKKDLFDLKEQMKVKELALTEHERLIPRLRPEIDGIKRELQKHRGELTEIQREFDQALKASGVKLE